MMKKLKYYLELFLQSYSYFSALYWVLKGFSKTLYFSLQFSVLISNKKPFQSHLSCLAPPIGPWPTYRRRPAWSNPTRWLGRPDPASLRVAPSFSSPSSSGNYVTFTATALDSGCSRRS
jgi:hypothetical protein